MRKVGDQFVALRWRQPPLERPAEQPQVATTRLKVSEVAPDDHVVEVGGVRSAWAEVSEEADRAVDERVGVGVTRSAAASVGRRALDCR